MAAAPTTAQRGRSLSAKTTIAANPRSARDAGSFISARMPGSAESVTVAKAGWTAASTAQMYAMTGPKATGPKAVPLYSEGSPLLAT